MKFNLKIQYFIYALTWPDFWENIFKGQSTFKKEKLKDEHFDMAQTRKRADCGSDKEMRWLALNPSALTTVFRELGLLVTTVVTTSAPDP